MILSLYNIKGGVGKTATAVNLAYLAAQDNYNTLLCDLDPQGSSTYYFRIKPSKKLNSRKLLKGGGKIHKSIKGTDFDNLDLLPADISYRNIDIVLDDLKRSKKRLKEALGPLESEYDLLVLDCPPNVTLLSENIFYASDYVIVPLIPTTLSLLSYHKLMHFFARKKDKASKITAFFSMVEKRKKMHNEILNDLIAKDHHFLKNHVPYSVLIEKMGIYREPVVHRHSSRRIRECYKNLWAEIKDLIK